MDANLAAQTLKLDLRKNRGVQILVLHSDQGKNKTVVEYSLAGYQNPIGVADWQNQIAQALPDDLKSSLPSVEEIEKELK